MDSIQSTRLGVHSRRASQPTSTLPPLTHLATHSTEQVRQGLHNLYRLYFQPEPATSLHPSKISILGRNIRRPVHNTLTPDSGYASAEEDDFHEDNDSDTDEELLRVDPFERSFAIKWLTGFISRSDNWITACDLESDSEERSDILDQAVTLLSAFTSIDQETEVALTRSFSFPLTTSSTLKKEIQVELNDAPLSKDDHTSVGLQSWGSSILLAKRICLQPSLFSLTPPIDTDDKPLRVLELGAGTGILSIVAAKILQSDNSAAEIVATDYHPAVLHNLANNITTNFPKSPAAITIKCLDWEVPHYDKPLDRPFDVILAADVIYLPEHARWIKRCVEKFLVRPIISSGDGGDLGGVFWLIIPVRSAGRHEGLDRTVEAFFPTGTHERVETRKDCKPHLVIMQKEEVGRQASVGRADEDAYKLFKIGWIS